MSALLSSVGTFGSTSLSNWHAVVCLLKEANFVCLKACGRILEMKLDCSWTVNLVPDGCHDVMQSRPSSTAWEKSLCSRCGKVVLMSVHNPVTVLLATPFCPSTVFLRPNSFNLVPPWPSPLPALRRLRHLPNRLLILPSRQHTAQRRQSWSNHLKRSRVTAPTPLWSFQLATSPTTTPFAIVALLFLPSCKTLIQT